MICVPITESSVDGMVKAANKVEGDVVELRLDYLSVASGLQKIEEIRRPVIATCMPFWDGGEFRGTESERISTLFGILPFCDFVTIEIRTKKELRNKIICEAKKRGVKVIISYHNFKKTETKKRILNIIRKQKAAGADIAKIAFKAKNYEDVMTTMSVLAEKETKIPIIAISMGPHGKISRILAPLLGSYLTFAASSRGKESAPGQLTVAETKKLLEIFEVGG